MSSGADPENVSAPGGTEIVRLRAENPGPMSLTGTNTYIVGAGRAYVIDPGPDLPEHVDAVGAEGERLGGIAGVILTHSHSDHSAAVGSLGAPLLWGSVSTGEERAALARATAALEHGFAPAELEDAAHAGAGAAGPADAAEPFGLGPFRVIPTPGHAADHVALMLEDVCFCGDLILGHGSTIVPPAAGGGSLSSYMRSLELLGELAPRVLYPGHGEPIADPAAKIREYTEHRLSRERRLIAALEAGERSRARLLESVWDDVRPVLRPAAALAMQAHLEKLAAEGRVELVQIAP